MMTDPLLRIFLELEGSPLEVIFLEQGEPFETLKKLVRKAFPDISSEFQISLSIGGFGELMPLKHTSILQNNDKLQVVPCPATKNEKFESKSEDRTNKFMKMEIQTLEDQNKPLLQPESLSEFQLLNIDLEEFDEESSKKEKQEKKANNT